MFNKTLKTQAKTGNKSKNVKTKNEIIGKLSNACQEKQKGELRSTNRY